MGCQCDMHGRGNACHCRTCCLTFSGPSAFDKHITQAGHRSPGDCGLVQVRPRVWGKPYDVAGSGPALWRRDDDGNDN